MPRLLLVTGSFVPVMLADMQRARMLAEALPRLGWDVEILTVGPAFFGEEARDPKGGCLGVGGILVHEVQPRWERFFRLSGVGAVGWRGFWQMYETGLRLLESGRFDLVYVSTAQFMFFCLGHLWKRRMGMPYVLDVHDPWVKPRGAHVNTRHRFKHAVQMALAGPLERYAFEGAAGVVAVSPDYIQQLRERLGPLPCFGRAAVIPFGFLPGDLELGRALAERPVSSGRGPERVVVYTGAGGPIMASGFETLCRLLGAVMDGGGCPDFLLKLYGTQGGWREGDPKILERVAESCGVGRFVREAPRRIGYVQTLELVAEADGLIVLGVDDPAYMPSKLFPYAATGKPLLACLHRDSHAAGYFQAHPELGELVVFPGPDAGAEGRVRAFLEKVRTGERCGREWLHGEHGAEAMASAHVVLFEACLEGGAG